MKINQIIQILEEWAPTTYAEDFDNVGLLVGDKKGLVLHP
jgi:putative NIF3 family GTP cyclohydrolase 1 type 2